MPPSTVFMITIVMLAVSAPQSSHAQETQPDEGERIRWLRDNAVAVRSIDPLIADDDFADLMPLRELIGDVQVVGLGEQTHGDGATFHSKIRLIKFLHEVMGFDVLVWESGMYDCYHVEQEIRKGTAIHDCWHRGIFGVWATSEQVQPLFEYIQSTRQTDRPLEIAGTDSQMTGQGTAQVLNDHVVNLYERAGRPDELAEAMATIEAVAGNIKWPPMPDHRSIDFQAFDAASRQVSKALYDAGGPFANVASRRERALLSRALTNFSAMVEMMYWLSKSRSDEAADGDMFEVAALREPNMADTLVWLAREFYPDRRLIVWAASSHLTYNSRRVELATDDGADEWKFDDSDWEPMGNRVRDALGDDFYVIDFIAYEGEIGGVSGWSGPLEPAPAGSLDALCHETGHSYLFFDFRQMPDRHGGAWLSERIVARPRGYVEMRADWSEICDAMFFTDQMYPSRKAAQVAPQDESQ